MSQHSETQTSAKSQLMVEIDDLSIQFKTKNQIVDAVKNLSFEINRGETVAVVGESGSGKSVTALSMMRLIDFSGGRIVSGNIKFNNDHGEILTLSELDQEKMRAIRGNDLSMIFQEPMTSLNPVFTIGMQVSEAIIKHQGKTKNDAYRIAKQMLELVRIPEVDKRLEQYPHQLSGGMRQRVMIAIALSCKPALLIADEPTTALDVTIQAQILDLIKLLQSEIGMSVMFITHDMGVVAEVADRVVVMLNGTKVEEGSVERIFNNPKHPYTKALLASVPRLGSMEGSDLPAKFSNVDTKAVEYKAPETKSATVESKDVELKKIRTTVDYKTIPLLQVKGLTTRFQIKGSVNSPGGNVHAVENVNFSIQPGETVGLVGESGCGKSTTGRSIIGLTKPTRGTVEFEGVDLTQLSGRDLVPFRKKIQMIFQDPFASLNPRMTVGDIVAEPIIVHDGFNKAKAREKVSEILTKVGMSEQFARRHPHELSGGQRQRIGIARALALEPKLIIADEAVSALDVSIQAQVINLLLQLQEDLKLSYLFISHDMAVVERVSHKVAVMYLGEIVEFGSRRNVFENPQHPYTKKLMSAVPVADPRKRRGSLNLATDEIPSLLKPNGFEPEIVQLVEVSKNHFVKLFT